MLASLTKQPQPIVGVLESELKGRTHPIACDLESSEQPQPTAGFTTRPFV